MPMKDLRAVYGDKKAPLVINAAIRAELVGGNEVLDALNRSKQILHNASPEGKIAVSGCINLISAIKEAMVSEILRRYNIEEAKNDRKTNE